MTDSAGNKRVFERYPLGFKTDIYTCSATEKQSVERVMLKDISGGGACFISGHPGFYAIGQKISLEICLPGTSGADAHMKGQATVVRVDDPETSEAGRPSRVEIGIAMNDLLSFQQQSKDNTNSGEKESEDVS